MDKLKTYNVELKITREYHGTVEVEAVNEDEAEEKGLELWHQVETNFGETTDWEVVKVSES